MCLCKASKIFIRINYKKQLKTTNKLLMNMIIIISGLISLKNI